MKNVRVFDPATVADKAIESSAAVTDTVDSIPGVEDFAEAGKPVATVGADGNINFAIARNPLNVLVEQLRTGRHYITQDIADRLMDIIPDNMKLAQSLNNTESASIDVMIAKLSRMASRLETATVGSSDTKELKDAFGALSQMISLTSKLKDDMNTERHLRAIEEATVAAFDEIGDQELKERFVSLLAHKLAGTI